MNVSFPHKLPAEIGAIMRVEDLKSWWRSLPGVAEKHSHVSPARRVQVTRKQSYYLPATTVWEMPDLKKLARMYARQHGSIVLVRSDDTCEGLWFVNGKIVSRKGKVC